MMKKDPGKLGPNQEKKPLPKFSGSAAEYLRIHKAQIVSRWTEAVKREILAANELATITLVDSLPEFLDDLADSLQVGRIDLDLAEAEDKKAEEHGASRAGDSRYSLVQVQDEYRVLRRVLFEELEDSVRLTATDREVIFESILFGMRSASAKFAAVILEREREALRMSRDSGAVLDALVHSAPLALGLLDRDLRYVTVNENLARLNGVPAEKHIGKRVREVLPEHAKRIEEVLRGVLESGEPVLNSSEEVQLPGDHGRTHWLMVSYFPVKNEDGIIIGVGGAAVDISEQKQAELRLKEIEAYRNRIFESSEDCFKILDLKGRLLSIEKESLRHLEMPDASTVTGSNWIEFWKRPEDKAAAVAAVAKATAGARGEFTGYFPTPSGKRSWWHVVLTPMLDPYGNPEKILAVSRDVTAIKRAEEHARESEKLLWTVADSIPTHIALVDASERIQFINKSLANAIEVNPQEVAGKPLREVLRPEFYQQLVPRIRAVSGGIKERFEYHARREPDAEVYYAIDMRPVFAGAELRGFLGTATDVTAMKRAEIAIAEREEQFRALANSIPQLSWMADPSGAIFWYNDRWYDYTGTSLESMRGWGWQSVQHPDYLEKVTEKFMRHIASGEPWEDTFPLRSKSGEWHWFLSRARPIRDEQGHVVRWFGTNTDVTEQREIQRELRESKERYDLALEVGRIGVWEMSLRSPEVKWSPRQFEIFGLDPKSGALSYDVFHHTILPEDKPMVDAELAACLKERRDFSLEYRIKRPNGEMRWVRANGKIVFDAEGDPDRMIGVNIDITGEKRAEEALRDSEARLRDLMNAMPAHLWSATPDGTITFLNHFWGEYTGQDPAVTIRDGTWSKAIHPEDREAVLEHWKDAVRKDVSFYQEYRILCAADGTYRWHVTRGVPVRDQKGDIRKWVGLSSDVEDLKRTQKLLEDSQALRERFMNTLTHDLRNPLAAAKMSAQLVLRNRNDAEKRDRHLPKIMEAIERVDRMIGDLLDANRIKAGERLPLRLGECDLRAIVVQSLDELSVLYGDRFVLREESPCIGHWSCEGLRRVVDNLATNAVKYGAPDAPITITISRSGPTACLRVHNEGNELSPAELAGLFDLYRRSERAEVSGVKGWGIGLTLVRGLVEAHGGTVKAESERGRGTTFIVALPLAGPARKL